MAHKGQKASGALADGTWRAQVLRMLLSSEADAQFLHTLQVSTDEFQALKAQQSILVDFGGFPGKIVSLLRKCSAVRAEHPPRSATGWPVQSRAQLQGLCCNQPERHRNRKAKLCFHFASVPAVGGADPPYSSA